MMERIRKEAEGESTPEITIIIPAFQEEKRISKTLDELARFLDENLFASNKSIEVLVVAADGQDDTKRLVERRFSKFDDLSLLKPGTRVGKGRDVQYGMLRAKGKYILFMDADLATPLYWIEKFYEACNNGADIVIGTRDLSAYRRNKIRNIIATAGNTLYRVFSRTNIADTQCGFKMFTQDSARICFSRLRNLGWGFDIEILTIANVHKKTVIALQIDDWQEMPYSTYNQSPVVVIGRSIKDFVQISCNKVFGRYK